MSTAFTLSLHLQILSGKTQTNGAYRVLHNWGHLETRRVYPSFPSFSVSYCCTHFALLQMSNNNAILLHESFVSDVDPDI